jgi:hypothetical protein
VESCSRGRPTPAGGQTIRTRRASAWSKRCWCSTTSAPAWPIASCPTVIIGDSRTHEPESSAALYGFLAILLHLKRNLDNIRPGYLDTNPMRFVSDTDGRINLICVDHVSILIIDLAAQPDSHNQVFHVATPESTPIALLVDAVVQSEGWNIVLVDDPSELQPNDLIAQRSGLSPASTEVGSVKSSL